MTRSDRRISMRLIAVLAGACALALTACSSSSSSSSSASSTATSSSNALTASKVTLVVYSAQGYDSAMTKAFTAATGIPVKLDDNSTGPLLTQIEASKNNPNWGLLWVDGATAFAGLDTQGLLLRGYEPTVGVEQPRHRVPAAEQELHPDRRHPDGGHGVRQDQGPDSARPPGTQLTAAQWKGAVGMNDPSQSGPTFPFIAGMMNYLGSVSAGQELLHQAQGQRPGHQPDQRPDPAGAHQRPDQARAGPELGGDRRGARRQEPRRQVPGSGHPAAQRDRHRRQGAAGRAGRGEAVHRVRPVARGPEGHAER